MRVNNPQESQNSKLIQDLTSLKTNGKGSEDLRSEKSLLDEFTAVLERIAATLNPQGSLDVYSAALTAAQVKQEPAPKHDERPKSKEFEHQDIDTSDEPKEQRQAPDIHAKADTDIKAETDTKAETNLKSDNHSDARQVSKDGETVEAKGQESVPAELDGVTKELVAITEHDVQPIKQDLREIEKTLNEPVAVERVTKNVDEVVQGDLTELPQTTVEPLSIQIKDARLIPTQERLPKKASVGEAIDVVPTKLPQNKIDLKLEVGELLRKEILSLDKNIVVRPDFSQGPGPQSTLSGSLQPPTPRLLDRDALINGLLLRQAANLVQIRMKEVPSNTPAVPSNPFVMGGVKGNDVAQSKSARPLPQPLPLRSNANQALERVESALKEAVRARDGKTISIRLDPPDLGTVKVDVSMRDGNLHARIVAESQSVSNLVRERAHELHTTLRKLGIHVDKVTIAVHSTEDSHDHSLAFTSNEHNFRQSEQHAEGKPNTGTASVPVEPRALYHREMSTTDHWVA